MRQIHPSDFAKVFPSNEIDPTAIIYDNVKMGTGNIIGPYCIIGAPAEWKGMEDKNFGVYIGNNNRLTGLVTVDGGAESRTVISDQCYLMKAAHVGHDCEIMSCVTISCGAKIGGHCFIDSHVTIGLNASIHQKVNIPHGCIIKTNAFVGKSLKMEALKKYTGVPARLIGDNSARFNTPIIEMQQFQGEEK
jgi:UDP-N-acetylglucosamine acyltransferase